MVQKARVFRIANSAPGGNTPLQARLGKHSTKGGQHGGSRRAWGRVVLAGGLCMRAPGATLILRCAPALQMGPLPGSACGCLLDFVCLHFRTGVHRLVPMRGLVLQIPGKDVLQLHQAADL